MSNVQVETQRQTRQAEGLALTWTPVSGAIRYGFVVGFPDLPVPPVDVIMKGATRDFAIMGVPAKYSGAVDLGSPVGEERQYGLIAYRGDGSIVPVPGVQFVGARSAPRDREYHSLLPPELVRSQPVAPAAPTPAVMAPSPPLRTADPWAALQELDTRPAEVTVPAPAALAQAPPPPVASPADPWDVLNAPVDDDVVAATDAAMPTAPAPSASIEYATPLITPELPAEPALAGVAAPPDDPWDVLNTLSTDPTSYDDSPSYDDSAPPIEERAPVEEDAFTTDAVPSPPLTAESIETPIFAVAPAEETPIDALVEESSIDALVEEPAIVSPVEEPLIDAPVEAAVPATLTEPMTEPVEELPVEALVEEPSVEELVIEAPGEDTVAVSDFARATVPFTEEIVAARSPVDDEPSLLEDVVPPEAVVEESLEPVVMSVAEPSAMPETEPVVAPVAEVFAAPLPASDFIEDAIAAPSAPTWDTLVETVPAVVDASHPEEHAPPASELEPMLESEPVPQMDQVTAPRWPEDAPTSATPPVISEVEVEQLAMSEVEAEQPAMSEADQRVVFVTELADAVTADVAMDATPGEMIEMESVAEPVVTDAALIEMESAAEPMVTETVDASIAPSFVEPSTPRSFENVAAMEPGEEAVSPVWGEQGAEAWLESEPSTEVTAAAATSPTTEDVEPTPEPVTLEVVSPSVDMAAPDTYEAATVRDEPVTVVDELDESRAALESEPARAAPSDEDTGMEVLPVDAVEGAMPDPVLTPFAAPDLAPEPSVSSERQPETVLPSDEAGFSYWTDSAGDADDYRDLAAMLKPDAAPAVEETPAPEPEPTPSEAAPAAVPLDPQTAASVAALLDEADLYLLPSWLDYAEASRLVAQAAAIAPADPRVRDLQQRIAEAQGDADGGDVDALLQEARRSLDGGDHWRAVDLYEQVLARHAENDDAREGLERARLYGRWAAQRAAAEGDATRLYALGDQFAAAPELAAQAYAEAFDVEPSVAALHGWLLALARDDAPGGGKGRVGEVARQGVGTLRRDNRIVTGEAQERALDALGAAVGTEALVDAVTALVETL